MNLFLVVGVLAIFANIPAVIAKDKGYKSELWWFYGFLLWPAAFIHSMALYDKNKSYSEGSADEIIKWKKLLDENIITQEEFDRKKGKLLKL